ncbi:MAG: hypothetical protein IKY33_02005 [Clostridia bacterium]|nr:hypothetical protein [Clostridia bacterium]
MNTKKFKKIILSVIALCLCMAMNGCSMGDISIEDLMRPPQLTESRLQVQNTIDDLLGTSYELVAPSGGDNRNDINLADLDSDGQTEAICLYTADETKVVSILILQKADDNWKELGRYTSDATGVEKLSFCDMTGDGTKELIVGWNYLTGSDRTLQILEPRAHLRSLYKGKYTQYVLMEDGPRIVCIDLSNASASLLVYKDLRITSLSSVPIDERIVSLTQLTVSATTAGNPAVYMDAQLEDQNYHTEILVVNSDNYLENKLLTGEGLGADRPLGLRCTDIDGDGIPEVPRCTAMEDTEGASYFTHWCKFDGSSLKEPLTTFTSSADRFYVVYPDNWVGKVMVWQDAKVQRLYHFVNRSHETLYSLRVFTLTEFSQVHPGDGWISITQNEDTVIAYRYGSADDITFTTAQWAEALHTY